MLESEWDDEFYSVHDGFETASSVLSISSPRDFNQKDNNTNSVGEVGNDGQLKDTTINPQVTPVFADEVSNNASVVGGDETHCGLLPNACLPCLASTVPPVDKKRSLSPGTPTSKRKPSLKLSFKWREEHATPTLCECLAPTPWLFNLFLNVWLFACQL